MLGARRAKTEPWMHVDEMQYAADVKVCHTLRTMSLPARADAGCVRSGVLLYQALLLLPCCSLGCSGESRANWSFSKGAPACSNTGLKPEPPPLPARSQSC